MALPALPLIPIIGGGIAAGGAYMFGRNQGKNEPASKFQFGTGESASAFTQRSLANLGEIARQDRVAKQVADFQAQARQLNSEELVQKDEIATRFRDTGVVQNLEAREHALKLGGVVREENFLTNEAANNQIAAVNARQAAENARMKHIADMDFKAWDSTEKAFDSALNFGRGLASDTLRGAWTYKG